MDDLGFFPITVELVTAPRTVYRACRGASLAELTESMRSNFEAARPPHPTDLKATVLHMAVSTLEDGSVFPRLTRRSRSRLWTHVAELQLTPGHGVCVAKTGGPGHWSVWGRPEVLATFVTDVLAMQS